MLKPYGLKINFYFWALHPVDQLSRLLEEPTLATTFKGVYFIYILLPLHVLALVGHLQAEYTTAALKNIQISKGSY
jgi:hypothetical protein